MVQENGGQCVNCGYDKCTAALEFHHLNPNKKELTIGKLKYFSLERARTETQKCLLVCSNCHRELHFGNRTKTWKKPIINESSITKQCASCLENVPIDFFYKSTPSWCKNCLKMYERNRNQKIKKELVSFKGGKCQLCEYDRCIDALEFHHKSADSKKFGIASKRLSMTKMKLEAKSCDLICANCHRETHWN